MGKAAVARRVGAHALRQEVVDLARLADRHPRVGLGLHAGARQRKDCLLDADLIHGREPALAEVRQRLGGPAEERRAEVDGGPGEIFLEARRHEVLLERDLGRRRDHPDLPQSSKIFFSVACRQGPGPSAPIR